MDELFNEESYRKYLENVYVWPMDKYNLERKRWIARYSSEYFQKIIDDTQIFIEYIIGELGKSKENLTDSVYTKIELIADKTIDSNLHGGYPADRLYNPIGFDNNFWVSKHLLEKYLDTNIYIDNNEIDYYDEEEEAGEIMSIPYLYIVMPKEQYKLFENNNILVKKNKNNHHL